MISAWRCCHHQFVKFRRYPLHLGIAERSFHCIEKLEAGNMKTQALISSLKFED